MSHDDLGANVTYLRCGMFFTNLEAQIDAIRSGTIPVILPVDHALPWVAPRDIAEVAATRLLSTDWSGRCFIPEQTRTVHTTTPTTLGSWASNTLAPLLSGGSAPK